MLVDEEEEERAWEVDGGRIDVVDHFGYLRDTINCDTGVERIVRCRVETARQKWKGINCKPASEHQHTSRGESKDLLWPMDLRPGL